MVRRWTTSVAIAIAVVAVSAGCGGSASSAKGTASAPTTPSTTSDPWAVPATVTPDYINKVLAKLNQIDGDAFRDARASRTVTARFLEYQRAIRATEAEVQIEVKDLRANIDKGFQNIRMQPGDRRMAVKSLLPAPGPCVLASVSIDLSGVTRGAPITYPQWYVALVPGGQPPTNPTHWALIDDGFEPNGQPPTPQRACS